jgi:hypothetical protein
VKRATLTRATRTVLSVESVTWSRDPDVSVFLAFADDLRKYVDAGYLDTRDKVSMYKVGSTGGGYFHLSKSTTEDEEIVDVSAPRPAPPVGTAIKAKTRSEAARLLDHDTDVMD